MVFHSITAASLQLAGTSPHSDIFFLSLSALMALVVFLDATRYIIPNWLVVMVLLLYPVMVLTLPSPMQWAVAASFVLLLVTFIAGYFIYVKKWMGGGDVKLLTACALWMGPFHMLDFLLIMALLGGALALALIVVRRALPRFAPAYAASPSLPRLFQDGAPLPYGLAIAAAFLILLWEQQVPGLALH